MKSCLSAIEGSNMILIGAMFNSVADNLVVEFKQYPAYSRNKRSVLNRNRYEEQVSMLSWFGGIRKLDKEEEIEKWNNLFASR